MKMVGGLKFVPLIAGAVGAVGVASVSYFSSRHVDEAVSPISTAAEEMSTLCLKAELDFWGGAPSQCLTSSQINALWDEPLMLNGRPIGVELSHPSDFSVAAVECKTCRQYAEMQWDGWYAPTSREMRREAQFVFACGTLKILARANPVQKSYFQEGSPTVEEMRSLGSTLLLRISDGQSLENNNVVVEMQDDNGWRLSAADAYAGLVREVANADFTNDGVEDVLVFLFSTPIKGTASIAAVALLEKTSVNGPVSVAFQTFRQGRDGI